MATLHARLDEPAERCAAGPVIAADFLQDGFQRHDALAWPAVSLFQLIKGGINPIRDGAIGHGREMIDLMEAAAHRGHTDSLRIRSGAV